MSIIKKQIYLHIGTPKTGTSALQKFFMENRSELERNGFSYPEQAFGENDISSGNGQEIVNLALDHGVDKARKHLNSLVKNSRNEKVLISTEAFYSHPELIHEIVPSAKIIVYFRNQLELVESSYNQAVKRSGQKASFSVALRRVIRTKEAFFTGELILKWVELFGVDNIDFRVYESKSLKNNNIYDDFLSTLGIDNTKGFRQLPDKINVSYCLEALDFKRCLNALTEGHHFRFMREVDAVFQSYSHGYFKSGGKKFSLYNREELLDADRFFGPYRSELAKIFNIKGQLFKESYGLDTYVFNAADRVDAILHITGLLIEREPRLRTILVDCIAKGLTSSSALVSKAALELSPLCSRPEFYGAVYTESKNAAAVNSWFTDQQLASMATGKHGEPDFLRDISVIVDGRGNPKLAHDLISRALELRPKGPKIIELEQYFRQKVKEQ